MNRDHFGLNELQRRRTPEGVGLWSSQKARVVLGHPRLAIIESSQVLHRQLCLHEILTASNRSMLEKRGTLWFASQACALAGCAPADRRRCSRARRILCLGSCTRVIFLVASDCRSFATDLRGTVASSATAFRSGSGSYVGQTWPSFVGWSRGGLALRRRLATNNLNKSCAA